MSRRDLTGAIDVSVLDSFTQGDTALADEVLGLFQQQANIWSPMLEATSPGWKDAVHTLKGSAAGIGAHRLAEACVSAEQADPAALAGRLEGLKDALAAALADVAAWRHELMLASLKG